MLAATYGRELSESGKVLLLVFNNELAKQLEADLHDANVKVATFHRLCIAAARILGEEVLQPLSSEWFNNTAPNLLKKAISGGFLRNKYTALIIDEAQVFKEEWLQTLVDWFLTKPILACCDETQVFSYEHLTPTSHIVDIMGVNNPFTLTINMRSPKSVFERVQEVFPSAYEQDSRRPFEEDTLEEVAVFEPLRALYETIRKLHNEGVDSRYITVIYIRARPMFPSDFEKMLNQTIEYTYSKHQERHEYQQAALRIRQQYSLYEWYHRQSDIEGFFNKVISIGKYRGLEAPIVIVYAEGKLDHASLACAYTRTTTKCIVIYNVISFFREDELNILQKIVVRDVAKVRSEVESRWPLDKAMPLELVVSKSATIYWSKSWKGWVIWEQWTNDPITTSLWRYHLVQTSNYPTYVINTRYEPWSISGVDYSDGNVIVSYGLDWCTECNSWTRWETGADKYCLDCQDSIQVLPPKEDIAKLQREDYLLSNSNATKEERRYLSPYLKAILYWGILDDINKDILRSRLREGVNIHGNLPYRYLFRIFTGIDILRTPVGAIIKRDELQIKYRKWFPDLPLDDIQLRDELTYGISNWIQRKLIQKVSKYRNAEYIRIEGIDDEEKSSETIKDV